jgi:hypothetical protein
LLHLLDSNVLITANKQYYPLARVPEFWDWLDHLASAGYLKVPLEMTEEIRAGDDDLAAWFNDRVAAQKVPSWSRKKAPSVKLMSAT